MVVEEKFGGERKEIKQGEQIIRKRYRMTAAMTVKCHQRSKVALNLQIDSRPVQRAR
jgi:hypothetical protein